MTTNAQAMPLKPRLTLPVTEWPTVDQTLWRAAKLSNGPFKKKNPAANWSLARLHIVEDAYGQWLRWQQRRNMLDASLPPGQRVTQTAVSEYMEDISTRLAPVSVAMMIGSLARMMVALEPEADWSWLRNGYQYLKFNAKPSRDKRRAVVPTKDLYDLGFCLMAEADASSAPHARAATTYRDGLIISVLAALPVRMANLSSIEVGRHLVNRDGEYWLDYPAAETKTGQHIAAPLPSDLTAPIERYLRLYRRILVDLRKDKSKAPTTALWVNRYGRKMDSSAIRFQIKLHTEAAFGQAVWPHLFRDCAATSIAIEDPENVGIAPDLLGHSTFMTTFKHYILAQSLKASRIFQRSVRDLRQLVRRR